MEPIFNDGLRSQLCAICKIRKIVRREGRNYQSELHRQLGVGLTAVEFWACAKILETHNRCALSKGGRDAVILTFTNAFEKVIPPSPEGVMNDEMRGAQ
jgi:hypothetical protein